MSHERLTGGRGVAMWALAVVLATVLLGMIVQVVAMVTAVPSTAAPLGDVSASRATWVQYLGVAGLFVGFIYTAMSYRLTRQSRVTDALISAVGDVGDRKSNVRRVGGIYALSILMAQEPSTRDDVERVLAAFVREYTKDTSASLQPEVLEALSLIGRRVRSDQREQRRLDLREANLEGVRLYGANLENCNLAGAQLRDVDLTDANLAGTVLSRCVLDGAVLRGCELRDAHLDHCSVDKTDFYAASTVGMTTDGTDMTTAANYRPPTR